MDNRSAPTSAPKVFLSYSWDDDAHTDWVLHLAERLRGLGVNVILDRWDARLGSDLALFMEQVGDVEIRVLAVVSDSYREKADDPTGGVGYEKRILTQRLMQDLGGDHVVPVLRNNTARKLPLFMGSARYADFSGAGDDFEDRLYELALELHGRPVLAKPALGANPFANEPTEAQARVAARMSPERYSNPAMTGEVVFEYENNSGDFRMGSSEHQFTLQVSGSGPGAVYIYSDPPDIASVAMLPGVSAFADVGDATVPDPSSRARTVRVGDAAILQNQNGFWAAVLLDEVTTRDTSEDGIPRMRFRYSILPAKWHVFGPGHI